MEEPQDLILLQRQRVYHVDLREILPTSTVYGRDIEQEVLRQWIVQDCCRIISVVGLGGIGKTTLVGLITKEIQNSFDYVFWYSLLQAPPLAVFMERYLRFLSDQQHTFLPNSLEEQFFLLRDYWCRHRCLLVLDNFDTIFQGRAHAGLGKQKELHIR